MRTWWIKKVMGFMAAAAAMLLALGAVVMLLWNAILPDVLQTPEISYWQAVGLLVLTHILFRGVGHVGYKSSKARRHWKEKFERKLAAMTPEERESFREEYRKRCGWDPGEKHHADRTGQHEGEGTERGA